MASLEKVIATLKSASKAEKRREAADILLQMGSQNPAVLVHSVPALVAALSDRDEGVVRRAAFAIYKSSLANPEVVSNYIPYLIKFMSTIGKKNVSTYGPYSSIANTLGVLGERYPDAVAQAIPYLAASINYPLYHPENPHSDLDKLYSSVLRALGRIGRVKPQLVTSAVQYIVRCLTDSFKYKSFLREDPNDKTSLRWSAAFAIDSIGHVAPNIIVPQLIKLMTDTRKGVRDFGYMELQRLSEEPQKVIPPLIHALGDQKPSIREEATKFLVELGLKKPKYTIPALVTCFKSNNDFVRQQAAYALGEIGKSRPDIVKAAVPSLLARLKDNNKEVRQQAIDALFKIGEKDLSLVANGVNQLIDSLKDPYHHVRWRAVMLLGMIGEKNPLLVRDSIPVLAHMFNDPQDHVRWRAEEALKRIGVDKSEYLIAEKAIGILEKLINEGTSKGVDMTPVKDKLEEAKGAMSQMEYKRVEGISEEGKALALNLMEAGSPKKEENPPTRGTNAGPAEVTEVYSAPASHTPTPAMESKPPASDKIFCPYCGAENYSNFNFCVKCRRKLPKIEESSPTIVADGLSDRETKLNIYRNALEEALKDGKIKPEEEAMLERLRETLGISMDEHYRLQDSILKGN